MKACLIPVALLLSNLILPTKLQERHYYPHSTDNEIEAQKGYLPLLTFIKWIYKH